MRAYVQIVTPHARLINRQFKSEAEQHLRTSITMRVMECNGPNLFPDRFFPELHRCAIETTTHLEIHFNPGLRAHATATEFTMDMESISGDVLWMKLEIRRLSRTLLNLEALYIRLDLRFPIVEMWYLGWELETCLIL